VSRRSSIANCRLPDRYHKLAFRGIFLRGSVRLVELINRNRYSDGRVENARINGIDNLLKRPQNLSLGAAGIRREFQWDRNGTHRTDAFCRDYKVCRGRCEPQKIKMSPTIATNDCVLLPQV